MSEDWIADGIAGAQASALAAEYIVQEVAFHVLSREGGTKAAEWMFETVNARIDELPLDTQRKAVIGETKAAVAAFFHVLHQRLMAAD